MDRRGDNGEHKTQNKTVQMNGFIYVLFEIIVDIVALVALVFTAVRVANFVTAATAGRH